MSDRNSFTAGRKWAIALNVALSTVALAAVIVMVNYLSMRHFTRFRLSGSVGHELSPLTLRVLQLQTNDVRVVVYFDRDAPLYGSVTALLREYQYAYPKMQLDLVDYFRDAGAAELIKEQFHFDSPNDKDLVVFECEDRTKRVYASELSDYDATEVLSGQGSQVRRTGFKGERLFTSALVTVTERQARHAFFLHGHGEHGPDDDEELMGYSRMRELLEEQNIRVETLLLAGRERVPAECQLLIVAGPTAPFLPEELAMIQQYLSSGGRMLLLFNHQSLGRPTGLESLMARWGVEVGRNVVLDPDRTFTEKDLFLRDFGRHPITRPISNAALYVLLPRTVAKISEATTDADGAVVEELAFTGPSGRVQYEVRNGVPRTDVGDAKTGRLSLMVAVEKGSIQGVNPQYGSTRIVVVGDSIFLGNETIGKAANWHFANHSINWLLDRQSLLGEIGARPINEYRLSLSETQIRKVRWILLAGMPGGFLLIGAAVWFRRRS